MNIFVLFNYEDKARVHFKLLLGFKYNCTKVQLRVQQGLFDALSNEPWCTLIWTPEALLNETDALFLE